jgi:hypothetical protein
MSAGAASITEEDGVGPVVETVVAVDRGSCERVIPLRTADLTRRLRADPSLSPTESNLLDQLGRLLAAVFHHEYHAWLTELKDLYAPLDPDSDCIHLRAGTIERSQEVDDLFLKTFEAALIRANYRPLDLQVIEEAIESPNELGLNYIPNFDLFEHLKIYVRGHTRVRRHVRRVKKFFRKIDIEYDAYQRMVVALKFKENEKLGPFARDDVLYLRLFKDVPHVDMEMHLPEQGTRVVMRTIDKAQIASPLMVGLPTFALKLLTASLLSLPALGTIMIAPISAGINSFFGFQRAKQKHLHHMIRNLYYLTLANNASVIETLIQSAEDEEYKEALLGYYFLWREGDGPEPWDQERLDRRVELFLHEVTGLRIDFEIADAVRKLVRLGLVESDARGHLRARPIESALQILDARWDDAFRYHAPSHTMVDVKQ